MSGDDAATLRIRERVNFDERYVAVEAWEVPKSDRFPDGIKYSFQYGEFDGETIFRYDNFPDHPGAPDHHKHTADGSVAGVEFEGIAVPYRRFKSEVNEHGHDWN